jgi:hypothetical protein
MTVLVILGTIVVVMGFQLLDDPAVAPNGGVLAAGFVGGGLVLLGAGFFDYLALRPPPPRPMPIIPPTPPGPLTLHGLRIGRTYRVRRAFDDHEHNHFEAGELLTFRDQSFVPYHGGYTLGFVERPMFLQETENRDVIDAFGEHLEPVSDDRRPAPVDPEDHTTVNAVVAGLPPDMTDQVTYEIAVTHGSRVAVTVRRIVDDVLSAPLDRRTATMDDGLRVAGELIAERYPWLDRPARAHLAVMFTMTWT